MHGWEGPAMHALSKSCYTAIVLQKLLLWIPLGIVITFLSGLIYVSAQQLYRQGANDPQIQIAEDTAKSLSEHQEIASIVPSQKIEMSESLSPFLMIFDANGKFISGNTILHGQIPTIPEGVFAYTKNQGEDKFTWQPESGVRSAAVVTKYINGYVLVGRSLREVEKREANLLIVTKIGWLVTCLSSLLAVVIIPLKKK